MSRAVSNAATFAAVYCIYDEDSLLSLSIESVYTECEGIYFLISSRPWFGEPADNRAMLDRIGQLPDPDRKIKIIRRDWAEETAQRNDGLEILANDGFTYCFIIDADEIYDPAVLRRMKEYAVAHPEVATWEVPQEVYWKSYRYRIEPRIDNYNLPVFVKVGSAHFYSLRHTYCNLAHQVGKVLGTRWGKRVQYRVLKNRSTRVFPPEIGLCHHLSNVRTDEQILRKMETSSHAPDTNPEAMQRWFKTVWKAWDSDHSLQNLHMINPGAFGKAVEQSFENLPPVLQRCWLLEEQKAS